MANKKILNPAEQYVAEATNNEAVFRGMIKAARPDIFVLMDILDSTGVNHYVIFQVIRQLYNLAIGSRWGKVIIYVKDGKVITVNLEEEVKLNEPVRLNESVVLPGDQIDKGYGS